MRKSLNYLYFLLFIVFLTGCTEIPEHVHKYSNGLCECGEKHNCTYVDGVCECGNVDFNNLCETEGHDYTIICTNDGKHILICSRNTLHKETKNCTFGEWITVIEAGPFTEGLEKHICTSCEYEETRVIASTHVHSYSSEFTADKEPTCEETGLKSKHCTKDNCSSVIEETVMSKLGHDLITYDGKDATCLETGYKDYVACTRCDYSTYEKLEIVDCSYEEKSCKWCGSTEGIVYEIYYGSSDEESYAYVSDYQGDSSNVYIHNIHQGYSVKVIEESAFIDCYKLANITIPNSVTNIGNSAFAACHNLTSIMIPDNVISIGSSAFYYCSSLTNINVDENNLYYKSIDGNLYSKDGSELIQYSIGKTEKSFEISKDIINIQSKAFAACHSLTSINVDKNNFYYKSIDGNLYSKDGSELIQYSIGKVDKLFEIPKNVINIRESAFFGCSNLKNITIGNNIKNIGIQAFRNCNNLTSVTIEDSVVSIEDSAFSGCTNLTSIIIGNNVTSIGKGAFDGGIYLKSIVIPKSVVTIGDGVFRFSPDLTIYCEVTSKPNGWSILWNRGCKSVVWGYKK